jgi:hypothetical protein
VFGRMWVMDFINYQRLILQLIFVNMIGIGMVIIGKIGEKKDIKETSDRKAKIVEFDFLKEEILRLYEIDPESYEDNSAFLKVVAQLKTMDKYDFDIELNESMKTMLMVLKPTSNQQA